MVSVREVLNVPTMMGHEVVAGTRGLDRPVRWVHCAEVLDVARFLSGQEFLITTGMRLKKAAPKVQSNYVRTVAAVGISAIGLELADPPHDPPLHIVDACNACELPLVIWRKEVKFRLITEEVARLLFERSDGWLRSADNLTGKLMHAFLNEQGAGEMLRLAHTVLGRPLCFVADDRRVYTPTPDCDGDALALRQQEWSSEKCVSTVGDRPYVGIPLRVAGDFYGMVWLACDGLPSEADWIFGDRIALALSCELTRQRHRQDVFRSVKLDLAEDLLSGTMLESLLKERLADAGVAVSRWSAVAAVKIHGLTDTDMVDDGQDGAAAPLLHDLAAYVSKLLPKATCPDTAGETSLVAISVRGNLMRVVLTASNREVLVQSSRNWLETVKGGWAGVHSSASLHGGVGRLCQRLDELPAAWHDVLAVLRYQSQTGHVRFAYFDDLRLYRFLASSPPADLRLLIQDELGPILSLPGHDREALIATLTALLDENFNVSLAARRLYLRRQSLYFRMERLRSLLGPEFSRSDRRVTLTLAVRAREMLGLSSTD